MDGENIPDEEISAAVAVGASVIEHWSAVSSVSRLIFKFKTGGLETWMASIPRTSVLFWYLFFFLFVQPIAGHLQK